MIRRPPRSTQSRSSAASDVYKRQVQLGDWCGYHLLASHHQVILRFDKHSDQLIDDRQLMDIAETTGISLRRGEILTKHHGVIAESVDGRLSFENTLEARLERKKPPLRALASEWLFEVNNG